VAKTIEADPRFARLVTLAKSMCPESDGRSSPPIDVHRHRPGACPEGPPCKGDD